MIEELLRGFRSLPRWGADRMDGFIIRHHQPMDVDGSVVICSNHWGNHKPTWPCKEHAAASERIADRRTA